MDFRAVLPGLRACTTAAIYAPLALPLDRILDALLGGIIVVVRTCSTPSWAGLPLASPPGWFLFAYYALFWGMAWRWQRNIQTWQSGEDEAEAPEE